MPAQKGQFHMNPNSLKKKKKSILNYKKGIDKKNSASLIYCYISLLRKQNLHFKSLSRTIGISFNLE